MRVTFYQRRPQSSNFSIERVFLDVRRGLGESVDARVAICRFPSRGLGKRVYNMVEAALRQGDVNHVTGDVHYLTLLLQKPRTLLTIHDLVSIHRLKGWRRTLFLFLWYWAPIQRSALISVISEFTKQELLAHVRVDPRRVRVVHDCVSDDFQPNLKEFNAARPVILQIGTGPNKNVERVAEALNGIPCHYRIIGRLTESQQAVLERCGIDYSSAAGISNEQVVEEYRRCDLVVFASTYEGFGMPIVEAQATGRPVVTSSIPPLTEVAGDAACLVDPYDVADIRAGVTRVIGDAAHREELVRRGFANVERFRPAAIAREYLALYTELLRGDARQ